MEEEISRQTIVFGINTTKLTGRVLANAMKKFLEMVKNASYTGEYVDDKISGKQSLESLMEQNAGAVNLEIDNSNIKDFDRVARKYHIDYAVKKDKTVNPPKYLVFFKSRDSDVMDKAFKEFIAFEEKKDKKPSLKDVLNKYMDIARSLARKAERNRERGRGGQSL